MKWTMANVGKPLISVGKLADAGNEVIFGRWPRVVNTRTGQVTRLKRHGGVYTIDLWIHVGKGSKVSGSNDSLGFARRG